MSDVRTGIREYLATAILFEGDAASFTEGTELIPGLVDSLGLMQLITFVEEEYGISFSDEEASAQNFATLGNMEALVEGKLAGAAAGSSG
jgi:acyl carrier protein